MLQHPAECVVLEGLEGKAWSLIQRDLTGWPRQSESQKVWCKRAHAKYGSNDRAVITSARTCLPSGPFAIVHLRLASGAQVYISSSSTAPQPFFSSTTPFVRTRTRTLHPTPSLSCSHTLSFIALTVASTMVTMASLPSAFMAFLLLLLLGVQINGQVARSVTLTPDLFAISDTPYYATAVTLSA